MSSDQPSTNSQIFELAQIDRRLFLSGVVAATVVGVAQPWTSLLAFADPTSAEKQAEADEVATKLADWKAQLDEDLRNYYAAMDAHDAAVTKMDEAQAEIDAAESRQKELQDKLGARAATQYKQGPLNFLNVVFGASTFVDFASSWDLMNEVNEDDARLIADSKATKDAAQAARDEYSEQERIASEKLKEAEAIKAEAEEIVAAYEAELAQLEEEVRELVEKEEREEAERLAREEAAKNSGVNNAYSGNGATSYPPGTFSSIVAAAQSQLGVPYVWGGSTPGVGLDCSGLTQWCYAQVGISIPRVDTGQYSAAPNKLPVSEAIPGDILWKYGHVAICTSYGGGEYIHAPSPGNVVCYSTYNQFTHALRW
ncbi:MAG: C40 family peptidase [Coriobacteriales bacterium]|jgi:cell wall-associated NlpC family hydrolase|nr:C40 family peptidase [Coriobacteriales bacterium]